MITLSGYHITECLYTSSSLRIFRGRFLQDKRPVIVKVLACEYPSSIDIAQIKREYEICRSLDLDGVIKPIALVPFQNGYAFVMEDFSGESLHALVTEQGMDIDTFLRIFSKISSILDTIHRKNLIHKDIKPDNILVNSATGEVKIIDFRIASVLARERQEMTLPDLIEGTPAYMAPEQTGRMNRSIDNRADLYALGVSMYELLTGGLPFQAADPLELFHSHVAIEPPSPCSRAEHVPPVLGSIVLKLLSKNADARYKSCFGLAKDLEECRVRFDETGAIETFPLGIKDISPFFQIPEKLYGREPETASLLGCFQDVLTGGSRMVLVSGHSGIGKTALVAELHKPISSHKGYFANGKFGQLKMDIPFFGISEALKSLVRQLLSEGAARVSRWKETIAHAVGATGQVIVDVIPEVEYIIGPQTPVESLPPGQAQNRFKAVFVKFIRALASREHPLVLFLDDLQWADSASLSILELLMSDSELNHFMMIGAFRDNEVSRSHSLTILIEQLEKSGNDIQRIVVIPLPANGLNDMVTDLLGNFDHEIKPLVELIMKKTNGNPFFIKQLLQSLYSEEKFYFDADLGRWNWNFQAIMATQITENVIELMCCRIMELPEHAQEHLKIAAAIGVSFPLWLLSKVFGQDPADTAAVLLAPLGEGFIEPQDVSYKYVIDATQSEEASQLSSDKVLYCFSHDRVQQAAYSLIAEENKKELHLRIGRIMLKSLGGKEKEEHFFDLVQQLNQGHGLLKDPSEKVMLAGLNLYASTKAKKATAYEMAKRFAEIGLRLLDAENFDNRYDLLMNLRIECAENEYMTGDFTEAEKHLSMVLAVARNNEDKAKVYEIQVLMYCHLDKMEESVQAGMTALRLLGEKLPRKIQRQNVVLEFCEIFLRLCGRKSSYVVHLPQMTDTTQQTIGRILSYMSSAAYFTDKNTFDFICLRGFKILLQHGNSITSAFNMLAYAIALASDFEAYRSGYDFANGAFVAYEKYPNSQIRAKSYFLYGAFFSHWFKPLSEGIDWLRKAIAYGIESGDLIYAGYAIGVMRYYQLLQGTDLDTLSHETLQGLSFAKRSKDRFIVDIHMLVLQLLKNLQGKTNDLFSLSDGSYNEIDAVNSLKKTCNANSLFHYYFWKGMVHFLYNDYSGATTMFGEAKQHEYGVVLLPSVADYLFYKALNLAACYRELPALKRSLARIRLAAYLNKFKKWAGNCPENFQHKVLLISAEIARIKGKTEYAAQMYDEAIDLAGAHGFIQNEAIANERTAQFYIAQSRTRAAKIYLVNAINGYSRWGAHAKILQMQEKYRNILPIESTAAHSARTYVNSDLSPLKGLKTSKDDNRLIDLLSVVKASQEISAEVSVELLLSKLMRIVLENAGARRGILLLEDADGKMVVKAVRAVDEEDSVGVEKEQERAQTIIDYVANTREPVVLDNTEVEGTFTTDPYVLAHGAKSILCMPLIKQTRLAGVLYLENRLTEGAFTRDRVKVLEMLSAQITISIENATLYSNLQNSIDEIIKAEAALRDANEKLEVRVRERTLALRQKTNDIQSMMQNMPEGMLTIMENGIIHHEYSTYLETILGTDQIAGRNVMEVVFASSRLGPDTLSRLRSVICSCMGEDILNFEVSEDAFIQGMEIATPDAEKTLELTWSPICDDQDTIEKLLLCLRDVTELRQLQKSAEQQKRELQIIGQILSVSREEFQNVIASSKELIDSNERLLQKVDVPAADLIPELFRNMHTIKGNARSYGFLHITNHVHTAENEYDLLRKNPDLEWNREKFQSDLALTRQVIQEYADIAEYKLGYAASKSDEELIIVKKDTIAKVLEQLKNAKTNNLDALTDTLAEVRNSLEMLDTQPLSQILSGMTRSMDSLAMELGKEKPVIIVEDNHIFFKKTSASILINTFSHIFRNSMDHGIESPLERTAQGKTAAGNIQLTVRQDSGKVIIAYQDDGRGLALKEIRKKAIAKELISENDSLALAETAQLLFQSGFSTTDHVSEVSGRGVGLDAVKKMIEDQQGTVHIRVLASAHETSDFVPVEFVVTLPDRFAIQARV